MEHLAMNAVVAHDSAMTLGMKLKRLAKARGMSREEILEAVAAQGVDLSKSALGNYFADINKPQLDVALALARALGVPLDYLADEGQAEPPASKDELAADEVAVLSHYRVQRRKEIEAGEREPLDPDELAWRIAARRVDYGMPIQDLPAAGRPGAGDVPAKGAAGNGG
jgi:transcriptional regulator with XRE-family HTH domain